MAAIEVIVVDVHQNTLLVVVELVVGVRLIDADTRVKHLGVLLVAYEQHFAMQIEQSLAQVDSLVFVHEACFVQLVVALQYGIKVVLHFHLGVKLVFEPEDVSVIRVQEALFGCFCIVAEHIAEEVRADIGFGHSVDVQTNAHVPQVLRRVRQRGREVSAQSPHIGLAHLPDAEEAEYMVDAVGVEVVLHLREAAAPPVVTVLSHLVPVIGREAPVLTADTEVIGRCTRRGVEVEQVGLNGCVHRVGTDADRYIALHRHAYRVCVGYSVAELLVGVELQEVVQAFLLFVALGEEGGVRLQPAFVLLEERLVLGTGETGVAVGLIECLEVDHLLVIYALVVGYRLGVELLFGSLVLLLHGG